MGENSSTTSRRMFVPSALILIVGFVLALVLFFYMRGREDGRINLRFSKDGEDRIATIEKEMVIRSNILESLNAFFRASKFVSAREFKEFVRQNVASPEGNRAMGWAPSKGEGRFPVTYLEPSESVKGLKGVDLSSIPGLDKMIPLTIDSGKAMTLPVDNLPGLKKMKGAFLVLRPVYATARLRSSPAGRRNSLSGFVFGLYVMREIVESALNNLIPEGINIAVYDVSNRGKQNLLYFHHSRLIPEEGNPGSSSEGYATKYDVSREVRVGDRSWLLVLSPVPEYINGQKSYLPLAFFSLGILFSLLLAAYAYQMSRQVALVKGRAMSLMIYKENLEREMGEREKTEEELRYSNDREKILRSILEISLEKISLEEQLERSLDLLLSVPWLGIERKGSIFLTSPDGNHLELNVQRGLPEPLQDKCLQVPFGTCLCGRAASTKKHIYAAEVDERHDIRFEGMLPHGHYCVPIMSGERVLGLINTYVPDGHEWSQDEEKFLLSVANTLAGLIMRKEGEEKQALFQTVIEQTGEGVVVTDVDGTIGYVNSAFQRITGYTGEEALGKNVSIVKSGEHGEDFYREIWKTIGSKSSWSGRFTNRKKDGTLYLEDTTISPILSSDGSIRGYVALKRDVTREVSLEEQLSHSQKMDAIGQLAGGVAHDFNNILTAIIGYATMLKMKMDGDDSLDSYIDQIISSADKAAGFTQALLTFSRKREIELKTLNIRPVLDEFGKLITRLVSEEIDITIDPGSEDLYVRADEGQMEQLLMNLSTNAGDAMPEGGSLVIRAERVRLDESFPQAHGYGREGNYALISVSDTGIGMDDQTVKKIFDPFFTTKDVGRGTGLGLSIAYGIIEQHGGFTNVYSEPGIGSTFRVFLPLVEELPGHDEVKGRDLQLSRGSETTLLAEDNEDVRGIMVNVLEEQGYRVIVSVDGEDALLKFKEFEAHIDLLLLDLVMPKKNGKAVYDELSAERPGLRAIILSGYTRDIIDKMGAMEEGIVFLSKPVSPLVLLREIRELLDS